MIGGFLWCTGNMLSVPVIKLIGLSLGLLIWGTTNMLMGWSSGTFGLFGLNSHTPDNVALNYCGVCVAVCALALYTQIRATNPKDDDGDDDVQVKADDDKTVSLLDNTTPTPDAEDDVEKPKIRSMSGDPELDRMFSHYASNDHASLSSATPRLLGIDPYMKKSKSHGNKLYQLAQEESGSKAEESNLMDGVDQDGNTFIDRLPKRQKRVLGVCMAAVAGILFGTNFDPPQYLVDHGLGPTNMLDYVWSHFCGIFLTSTFYFLVYCYFKKEPIVNKELILPGFLSGVMWAIADTCWFYANSKLSMQVAFPIITSGPGFVAAMWGMLVFGENSGHRNHIIIAIAFVLTVSSDVMIGISSPP